MSSRLIYGLAVGILLLATGLRMWQLSALPSGLHEDEITTLTVVDALRAGGVQIIYPTRAAAQEGLYPTTLTVMSLFTGDGLLAQRLLSVWSSLITLALTYTLGVRLFGNLAGLCAMALLAFMFEAVLLSRVLLAEAFVPLFVVATLLALARAFPVYRNTRDENTTTQAFAVVGLLVGVGLYFHPISWLLVVIVIGFILYRSFVIGQIGQPWSFIGFATLLSMILAIPYLIFIINRPEYSPALRLFSLDTDLLSALVKSVGSIAFRGDANPVHNLPQRPLIDLFSAILAVMGLMVCIRYWRVPRFMLLLLAAVLLFPTALLAPQAPNFFAFAAILPLIALFFGTGVSTLMESLPTRGRRLLVGMGILALFCFQFGWTAQDFFRVWANRPDVQTAYHAYAGNLARYLDQTADQIPTVLCDRRYNNDDPNLKTDEISAADLVIRLMNRENIIIRRVNCLYGMVFVNGGATQQVILPSENLFAQIHPYLQAWLQTGTTPTSPLVAPEAVFIVDSAQPLADRVGLFTTTATAMYESGENAAVLPPVRLGENLTWLGYDIYDTLRYKPGDVMNVITYWRTEGTIPSDLMLFVHVLSDPVTIVRQRDTISVQPRDLQERDVFIQITQVDLPLTLTNGMYTVSMGAYRTTNEIRLPIFDTRGANPLERGNRLLLYPIQVETP